MVVVGPGPEHKGTNSWRGTRAIASITRGSSFSPEAPVVARWIAAIWSTMARRFFCRVVFGTTRERRERCEGET
jgi:hypothetical protein